MGRGVAGWRTRAGLPCRISLFAPISPSKQFGGLGRMGSWTFETASLLGELQGPMLRLIGVKMVATWAKSKEV